MKLKTLLIVVFSLAAVSLLAWFINRPTPPPSARDPRLGKPILDTASAEKAARITLTEKGKSVVLARTGDGGWEVSSYHDLPVDFSKLAAVVKSLNSTNVERLVTSSPDRITRLEFADTNIAVSDSSGKPLLDLNLGKNADAGGGRYLRFDKENKAYLARLTTWLDLESRNWADTTLARFSAPDIARITFDSPVSVTVSRAAAAAPFIAENTPEGHRLKTDTINALLGTLANLRFTETKATDDPQAIGARAAARTVSLTTFDGKTVTFAIGRQPERTIAKPDAITSAPLSFIHESTGPAPADLISGITEKQPAGPVFVFIEHSDKSAPVNTLMKKRAFQVSESTLNTIPITEGSLFENIPPTKPVESESK